MPIKKQTKKELNKSDLRINSLFHQNTFNSDEIYALQMAEYKTEMTELSWTDLK